MSCPVLNSLLAAAAFAAALLLPPAIAAAELAAQTSDAAGVMVSARPLDLSPGAREWRFELSLNTHTVPLSDDLARTARLVDDAGHEQGAVAWNGDGAGGHHRRGTVSFRPVQPRPQAVELRIQRPGEAAPRTFRWKLQ